MKTRQGFVSNSSSSSFVIMTTMENHKRVLNSVHPYIKAVIKAMGGEKSKFLGQSCIAFGNVDIQGNTQFDCIDVDWDEDQERPAGKYDKNDKMSPSEAFDAYCEALQKGEGKKVTFSMSQDC